MLSLNTNEERDSSHQAEIHETNTTTEWTRKQLIPEEQLLHIPKPNVSFPLHRSILILDVGQEARFSSRCLKLASFIPTGWNAGWRLKQIFEYLTLLKKIKNLFKIASLISAGQTKSITKKKLRKDSFTKGRRYLKINPFSTFFRHPNSFLCTTF